MCRTGGRRCPSYSDPQRIAERNARRREKYAKATPSKTVNMIDYLSYFQPFDVVRKDASLHAGNNPVLVEQSETFAKTIIPGYDPKTAPLESPMTLIKKWDGTKSEQDALMEYTISGFKLAHQITNKANLETGGQEVTGLVKKVTEDDFERFKKVMVNIDSALAKAEKPAEPRVVYRGIHVPANVDNYDQWLTTSFPVGGVISQKNYMSTTADTSMALVRFSRKFMTENPETDSKNVVFEIVSRQGAVLGQSTSGYGTEESEILMPRNAKFKVVSVDKNVELSAETFVGLFSRVKQKSDVKAVRTVIRLIDVEAENSEAN